MASLRDKLQKLFPSILSPDPSKAINGTELYAKVKDKLGGGYAEASIRQHFSVMSADPTTCIAKVDQGHGYYLRRIDDMEGASADPLPTAKSETTTKGTAHEPEEPSRDSQCEEKLRAVFMRYSEVSNRFPKQIEHTAGARQRAGVNKWKFPDVIVLEWEVGKVTDDGFRLEKELLEVKRSLGEQPFRLISVELKVALSFSTFRENFFQCVSNSKWAHTAQLIVGEKIADRQLVEELRRLGTSYDVSVLSYGFEPGFLEALPPADKITAMKDAEFEKVIEKINLTQVSSGKSKVTLDWEHIRDLRSQSEDFNKVFDWTARCLEMKAPLTFADFQADEKVRKKFSR